MSCANPLQHAECTFNAKSLPSDLFREQYGECVCQSNYLVNGVVKRLLLKKQKDDDFRGFLQRFVLEIIDATFRSVNYPVGVLLLTRMTGTFFHMISKTSYEVFGVWGFEFGLNF